MPYIQLLLSLVPESDIWTQAYLAAKPQGAEAGSAPAAGRQPEQGRTGDTAMPKLLRSANKTPAQCHSHRQSFGNK